MNSPAPAATSSRRRQIWWWVLGLTVVPSLIFAGIVLNFVTLDRGTSTLRRELLAGTNGDWHTRCQLSLGALTISAIRNGLYFVDQPEMGKARAALQTVRKASVGVYVLNQPIPQADRSAAFARADRAMAKRGWSKLVGVCNRTETVLVYMNGNADRGDDLKLCVGVISGQDLIVCSTQVDADELGSFIRQQVPDEFRSKLHLAKR